MAKIFFTDDAKQDLQDIKNYVKKQWSKAIWDKENIVIKNIVDALKANPSKSTVPVLLSQVGMHNYRQILTKHNRIIYYYDQANDNIFLLLIMPQMRDYTNHLFNRMINPPKVNKASINIPITTIK